MNILVMEHVESEGPGTFGTFLETRGARLHAARLYAGDPLPSDLDRFAAIVSMGGPMNVYEEESYPFLREETKLLRRAINEDRFVLGVCLGAQLIAKAGGAEVTLSPQKEVGWGQVMLTDAGKEDALFQGLPDSLTVFQWHGDMFHIPASGTLLARGNECPHQAFRHRNAFGLQFHVEVTGEMLRDWFADLPDLEPIMQEFGELEHQLARHAARMYENFFALLKG
ncbi:MAG: type 1 glutamine amidotransferase [Desulfomonile tiedjei]|nr:type 1 glutamine amidotransferase [Desulfomonile tiedjei]